MICMILVTVEQGKQGIKLAQVDKSKGFRDKGCFRARWGRSW